MRRDWTRLRLLGLESPSTAANPLVTVEEAIGCEACRRAKLDGPSCRAVSRFAGTRGAAGVNAVTSARAFYRAFRGCETRVRRSTLVPNGKVGLGRVRVRRCVRSCAPLPERMLASELAPNPSETVRSESIAWGRVPNLEPNLGSQPSNEGKRKRSRALIGWNFRVPPRKMGGLNRIDEDRACPRARVNNRTNAVRSAAEKCGRNPRKRIWPGFRDEDRGFFRRFVKKANIRMRGHGQTVGRVVAV